MKPMCDKVMGIKQKNCHLAEQLLAWPDALLWNGASWQQLHRHRIEFLSWPSGRVWDHIEGGFRAVADARPSAARHLADVEEQRRLCLPLYAPI